MSREAGALLEEARPAGGGVPAAGGSGAATGGLKGNNSLRVQLMDVNNNFYCYGGALNSGVPIPIGKFNTQCWSNTGTYATASTLFKRVDVLVPGTASTDQPFAFCLTNVTVQ